MRKQDLGFDYHRYHRLLLEADDDGKRLALAVPQTYMNDSGAAVAPLVRRFGIEDLTRLVVVHDELDLPVGRIQVKTGGGLAGHNGLKSIKAHLHTDAFTRVRIGSVGKEEPAILCLVQPVGEVPPGRACTPTRRRPRSAPIPRTGPNRASSTWPATSASGAATVGPTTRPRPGRCATRRGPPERMAPRILRRNDGAERTLTIVGEDEAAEGGELVAWPGPFVQALFGLKAGQTLDWDGANGAERWTVASVEYP